MPKEWTASRLADVIQLKRGYDLPTQDRWPGTVPILGSFGVTGSHNQAKVSGPGVTIGRSGASFGVATFSRVDFWPLNTTLYVEDFKGNDPLWVYWLLRDFDFSSYNSGSAQPSLNRNYLANISIEVPPLAEQRRIAGVLGALDDLIEVNRGLMDHLRSLITAVYRQMMNEMKPPDKPIFDVFEIDFGAAFKGSAFSQPGVGLPLLRIRDLKTFSPGTWTTERVKGDVIVSAGDVVVGMDAEFRPTFWIGPESLLNQRVCRVRSRVGGNAFVRESLVKPLAFIEGHKTGTTVSHLNKADLLEVSIPVPDATALTQFDEISEPLLKALVLLSQEIDELVATRDELLPLLMSGRVRVREDGVAA